MSPAWLHTYHRQLYKSCWPSLKEMCITFNDWACDHERIIAQVQVNYFEKAWNINKKKILDVQYMYKMLCDTFVFLFKNTIIFHLRNAIQFPYSLPLIQTFSNKSQNLAGPSWKHCNAAALFGKVKYNILWLLGVHLFWKFFFFH